MKTKRKRQIARCKIKEKRKTPSAKNKKTHKQTGTSESGRKKIDAKVTLK